MELCSVDGRGIYVFCHRHVIDSLVMLHLYAYNNPQKVGEAISNHSHSQACSKHVHSALLCPSLQ